MPAHRVNDPLVSLSVRIAQSLRDRLNAQAIKAGVTLADQFCSHLTLAEVKPLGVPVKRRRLTQPLDIDHARCADPALLRSLAAIGSNLNQVARAVNTGAIAGDRMQAIELLVVLRAMEREFAVLVASSAGSTDAH
jgi:hypothetical protein